MPPAKYAYVDSHFMYCWCWWYGISRADDSLTWVIYVLGPIVNKHIRLMRGKWIDWKLKLNEHIYFYWVCVLVELVVERGLNSSMNFVHFIKIFISPFMKTEFENEFRSNSLNEKKKNYWCDLFWRNWKLIIQNKSLKMYGKYYCVRFTLESMFWK